MDYQHLLNHLPLGVFRIEVASQNKRFVFVNDALAALLDKGPDVLVRARPDAIFQEEKDFQRMVDKAIKTGAASEDEIFLKASRTGSAVSLSLVATKDPGGRGHFVDGIMISKAREREAETEKAASKELFQTVFDHSAAAILVADRADKIFAWNPFARGILGREDRELFNKPLGELFERVEWERLNAVFLKKKGAIAEEETRIVQPGGQLLDVSMSASFVKDGTGEITGKILIMLDISRQKEAERKIRESENTIRVILDNSAAAITMTDSEERIISWNRYAETLFGKDKTGLYLQHVSVLYPPEEWQKIRDANIRRDGARHHMETRIVRNDGKIVDVDLSVNVLKDADDHIVGSVGIMQDITAQKKVQQELIKAKIMAEEANSAKSLFLANMSHEVRTPMNTIIGMIDLTLDTQLTDEQRDNLNTVKNASDILLSLLNDILDLSRVEAGKIQLENIELSIVNILKSVCKGLSVLATKKGINLVWETPPDLPEILIGDPVRIRQILVNLINNAIKFTFKGDVVTKVVVKEKTEEFCVLEFSVRDEGIGIPKDKREKIFEVFTQADASTTRRFGGTGLGLAISGKLVEMMGGRIWVESEEFRGSTFYFTTRLQCAKAPDVSSVMMEAAPPAPQKTIRDISILLAEDNIVNQKIAARMLEKRGWTVKTAENGKQVLEYLEQGAFDLILMDAQMPVLDGYQATAMIRRREKKTGQHIPIVALTARAMSGDRKRCLDAGMDSYVSKPIDREKLYEAIEKFFLNES